MRHEGLAVGGVERADRPRRRPRRALAGVVVFVAVLAMVIPAGSSSAVGSLPSAPSSPPSTAIDPALRARLEAALDEGFATSGLPGVTVGLWIPGQGEWVASRGVSDTVTDAPMDRANQAPVGSVTKTFTATLALQVIGEGRSGFTLDSTIDRWYPDFPEASSITVRMLLNMSSGIAAGPTDEQWTSICSDGQREWWTPDEQIAIAAGLPRSFPPGQGYGYSNFGYLIVGRILEKVTGTDFTTLVNTRLLDPLGMSRSRFDEPLVAPFSHGYTDCSLYLGPPPTVDDTYDWDRTYVWSAGAMATTIDDLHTWGLTLADGYALTPEMSAARTNDLNPYPSSIPGLSYGLGLFVEKDPATNCVVSVEHGGDIPGSSALVATFPTSGAVFALMANSAFVGTGRDGVASALKEVFEPLVALPPTGPCDTPTPTTVVSPPAPAAVVTATPAFTG